MATKRSKRIVIDKALDWKTFNLAEAVKSFYFETDEEGNLKAIPVILIDPDASIVTVDPTKVQGLPRVGIRDSASGNVANVDAYAMQGLSGTRYMLNVAAAMLVYNPNASGPSMEGYRTPSKYKWASCVTAAATIIWSPTAGTKFRLMGGVIVILASLAAAALQKINFLEETLGTFGLEFQIYLPAAIGTLATVIPFTLGPNGYLASAADKDLTVTMTANLGAGAVSVTVWGTEE